ncbi:aminodeoxychorismate synthase component I [Methylogaea oryzae]|uniref:aminodeoxychorismate synthase component I n=1 Tax=Methylogaea oryzae TaxID=1295382 RepID=UPI000A9FFC7C
MVIGLYDWAVVVDHRERRSWLVGQGRDARTAARWNELQRIFSQVQTLAWQPRGFRVLGEVVSNLPRERYARAFERIQHYIREGDCYQVNLAQRFSAPCQGSPWHAYHQLRRLNCAPFSAYLNHPQVQTLSSSPERFLQVQDGVVETKPIKGTRPRGADSAADFAQAQALRDSLKDRAENLMIVDLLRNDLGKSCRPGSVHVPKLFDVESFATVHHLVSTVRGQLADGVHALDLLRGCFPGGSITGAPKVRAMEIIEELEPNRRGIYCGAIGYVGFDGNMDTNIAIRTLVHSATPQCQSDHAIRFWAGGGIVADSVMEEEYRECYAKLPPCSPCCSNTRPSPSATVWVVKFGGSLTRSDALEGWLRALAAYGRGRVVIVPGGGPFADAVRVAQHSFAFGDRAAHAMALLAMHQYAWMLQGLCSALSLEADVERLESRLAQGEAALWLPDLQQLDAADVPASWNVTSDSLAAWLAARLGATDLLMVKSVAVAADASLERLRADGVVDEAFAGYARSGVFKLHWAGPADSGRLSELLDAA